MNQPRTIIEEAPFTEELRRLSKGEFCRADEFVDGAKWVLARNPELGHRLKDTFVWCMPVRAGLSLPAATIYYTFGKSFVVLMSIVVLEGNGED